MENCPAEDDKVFCGPGANDDDDRLAGFGKKMASKPYGGRRKVRRLCFMIVVFDAVEEMLVGMFGGGVRRGERSRVDVGQGIRCGSGGDEELGSVEEEEE